MGTFQHIVSSHLGRLVGMEIVQKPAAFVATFAAILQAARKCLFGFFHRLTAGVRKALGYRTLRHGIVTKLFLIVSIPASTCETTWAQLPRPPPKSGSAVIASASSSPSRKVPDIGVPGIATSEVDAWKAQLEGQKEDLRKFRSNIGGLASVFRDSTSKLRGGMLRFKQNGDEVDLLNDTILVTDDVVQAIGRILSVREKIMLTALDLESGCREKEADLRITAEKLDGTVTAIQTALMKDKTEMEKLRLRYETAPSRELKQQLRQAFDAARKTESNIQRDRQKAEAFVTATRKMRLRGDQLAAAHDALGESLSKLDVTQNDLINATDVLRTTRDLGMVLGHFDVASSVTVDLDQLNSGIEDLSAVLGEVLKESQLGPDADDKPIRQSSDTEFETWLRMGSDGNVTTTGAATTAPRVESAK